ncbi:hypothetical protein ACPF4J_003148 [Vibrio cholerae]
MINKKLFLFYACVIIVIFVGFFAFFSTANNMRTKINESASKARAEALLMQEEHEKHKAARQKLKNELDATSIELSRISEIHSELYVDCMWKTDHNKLLCLSNLKNLTETLIEDDFFALSEHPLLSEHLSVNDIDNLDSPMMQKLEEGL